MRRLYTILFYCALPFILLRLLWRARKNPAYARRWSERFGCLSKPIAQHGIWIHAVSVGETIAAIPLIKALQQRYPDLPILVTTTTPTGADRVQAVFAQQVSHAYLPYDLPGALQRFVEQVKPQCLIIMETELWPNLLHICAKNGVNTLLANARLSEQSAAGYQKIGLLTRAMLKQLTVLAAQSPNDATRFLALGMNPERLSVTGSIKFDLEIPTDLTQRALELRTIWGKQRPVWIAASTHEGEEELILNAHVEVRKKIPDALLVLVPRHLERFNRVAALAQRLGFKITRRSECLVCAEDTGVFIGDSMGELLLFYAAADVAFVGGSLVPVGGHNPLEPAALSLPVLMGPHLFNFAHISQELISAGAMLQIKNAGELAQQIIELLQNTPLRQQMGAKGERFVAQNRGAVAKHLALLEPLLINKL